VWSVLCSPDGVTWQQAPTNTAVDVALILSIGDLDGDNSISNFVLYGFSDPTTYGRTNDLT